MNFISGGEKIVFKAVTTDIKKQKDSEQFENLLIILPNYWFSCEYHSV